MVGARPLFVILPCLIPFISAHVLVRDVPWSATSGLPLRVCTASNDFFGARCNDGLFPATPSQEPIGGWCPNSTDLGFCGYDVEVWRYVLKNDLTDWIIW